MPYIGFKRLFANVDLDLEFVKGRLRLHRANGNEVIDCPGDHGDRGGPNESPVFEVTDWKGTGKRHLTFSLKCPECGREFWVNCERVPADALVDALVAKWNERPANG